MELPSSQVRLSQLLRFSEALKERVEMHRICQNEKEQWGILYVDYISDQIFKALFRIKLLSSVCLSDWCLAGKGKVLSLSVSRSGVRESCWADTGPGL